MVRVLALLRWKMHSYTSDNNYFLLDFAASVYIFHNKDKFTNLKKAIKGQRLLCGINIIIIKSWGDISLLLRIRNKKSILILKEVFYVSNFPFNHISLVYLEDEGYRWYY